MWVGSTKNNKKYEISIIGNVFLYNPHLMFDFNRDLVPFLYDENVWKQVLKQPIGVITHNLDSPAMARQFFIEQGGKPDEK